MKAYYSTDYGGPEVSKYGDLPDPVHGDDQLLIEVKAASINPVDYKFRRGDRKSSVNIEFPWIFGSDFAGIVRGAGKAVTEFRPGDRVYGTSRASFKQPGTLAELLVVSKSLARKIPDGMPFTDAAALPIAGLTALNGIKECIVTAGNRVLINGASGGVGHFAIQIAKATGAFVTATCSEENFRFALNLGADEATGYGRAELASIRGKFDAIIDAFGRMDFRYIWPLLKRGGIYASTLHNHDSRLNTYLMKLFSGKKVTSANAVAKPENYEELERLYKEKKLRPSIEHTFTLAEAGEAFRIAESGRPRGKVIVTV